MKKVFKFALIAFAAAAVCVACKDNKGGDEPEPTPVVESDWSVIGSIAGDEWKVDIAMAQDGDIYVAKSVTLTAADEFKIRYQKAWDANRGGTFVALGQPFAVEHNGVNIKPGLDGKYDIYYNSGLELMEVTAEGATPDWTIPEPEKASWDYVMDIHDYNRNSEFHFTEDKLVVDPKAVTMQWKFYADEWHDYDKTRGEGDAAYHVWCNRLGQISNSAEKGWLLRFNDGGAKGSLRFNSDVFGNNNSGYVGVNGDKMYIWELNKWHVLTIVADGTNVTIYDNAEKIDEYAQSTPEVFAELPIERFDISMTWDDGTGYPRGQEFLGYIAFTRIWTKALSAEQVAATLCDVEDKDGLAVCWNWNLDEGHVVANQGSKGAAYDLDFTKALAGGQQTYVKATDIEGAWTDVNDVEGLAPVCAE